MSPLAEGTRTVFGKVSTPHILDGTRPTVGGVPTFLAMGRFMLCVKLENCKKFDILTSLCYNKRIPHTLRVFSVVMVHTVMYLGNEQPHLSYYCQSDLNIQ